LYTYLIKYNFTHREHDSLPTITDSKDSYLISIVGKYVYLYSTIVHCLAALVGIAMLV